MLVLDSLEDPQNVGTPAAHAPRRAGVHGVDLPDAPLGAAHAGGRSRPRPGPWSISSWCRWTTWPGPWPTSTRGACASSAPTSRAPLTVPRGRPPRAARARRRQRGPGPVGSPSGGGSTSSCASRCAARSARSTRPSPARCSSSRPPPSAACPTRRPRPSPMSPPTRRRQREAEPRPRSRGRGSPVEAPREAAGPQGGGSAGECRGRAGRRAAPGRGAARARESRQEAASPQAEGRSAGEPPEPA